jgi:hypothetical protein
MDGVNFFVIKELETEAELNQQLIGTTTVTAQCAFQRKIWEFAQLFLSCSPLFFVCPISANKFLFGDTIYPTLTLECLYDQSSASAHWVWRNPSSPASSPKPVDEDLPLCTARCEQDPKQGPLGVQDAIWNGKVTNAKHSFATQITTMLFHF